MNLNAIRDLVLNSSVQNVLKLSKAANESKSKWQSKAFIAKLLEGNNLKMVDFDVMLLSLYSEMATLLDVKYSTGSHVRGRLRGFIPIGSKALEEAVDGTGMEVPLERSLALVNEWFCQFSTLSGYDEKGNTYKRKSIDLAYEPYSKSDSGYLIELKEWNGSDHILFAAIEVIIYWICFICVRRIDVDSSNPQAKEWPVWSNFKLRVMAPDHYFTRQPSNYTALLSKLNGALDKLINSQIFDSKNLCVNSCSLSEIPIHLKKEDFQNFLSVNGTALKSKRAKPSDLEFRDILECKLK